MTLAIIPSRALLGVQAVEVSVETHLSNGLPGFAIVGMPETAVRESKERVRSAILNSGLAFPERRITVNLAPADLPKVGGQYDLAIALSILLASGQLPADCLHNTEVMGELALDGKLRRVRGAIAAVLAAKQAGRKILLPVNNRAELSMLAYEQAHMVESLIEYVDHIQSGNPLAVNCTATRVSGSINNASSKPVFLDVKGQSLAKRAVEIAAAGRHNLLFIGPPGCGKTMLARNLVGLLPALTESEAMEVAAIRSIANLAVSENQMWHRPLRCPHHSATNVALVGGGNKANPGEVSLAHHGVLFLDEFTEFKPMALDALREPLEAGEITVSRANYRISYPANFQLIAAMNPCPCGNASDPRRECRCSTEKVARYLGKLSGPLLDRIDLLVELPSLTQAELLQQDTVSAERNQQTWNEIKARVAGCQHRQLQRCGKLNSALASNELESHCQLQPGLLKTLARTMDDLGLSARAVHRILKVARTIADCDEREEIAEEHLLEAVAYRRSHCMQAIWGS